MWVEHIKLELINSLDDPVRLERILQALLLFSLLELIPDPIEEELFVYLDHLSAA